MKRKVKRSLKKFVISALSVAVISTCVGCARNDNNKKYNQEENSKIETVMEYDDIDDIENFVKDEDVQEDNVENETILKDENVVEEITIDEGATNLDVLNGIDKIDYLKLVNTDISDFSMLKNIKIQRLQIIRNSNEFNLNDINNNELQQLYIKSTKLSNERLNCKFDKLDTMILIDDNIESFSFIENCKNLRALEIKDQKINDTVFLNKLNKLEKLSLINSGLCSIDDIVMCNNLNILDLSKNRISDISKLGNLNQLSTLNLNDNYIQDISSLEECKNINIINLNDNYIKDISSLSNSEIFEGSFKRNHIEQIPADLINDYRTYDFSSNNIKEFSSELENKISNFEDIKLNIFDNNMSEDIMKKLASIKGIYFGMDNKQLNVDEAIRYNKEVDRIIKENTDNNMNNDKKVMGIYSYIMNNCGMDYAMKKENRGNEYGAIVEKNAVCEGYSRGMTSILRRMGIASKIYYGDLNDLNNNYSHAWNLIKTESGWKHYDAFTDINRKGSMPNCYGMSDKEAKEKGYYLLSNNKGTINNSIDNDLINDMYNDSLDRVNNDMYR